MGGAMAQALPYSPSPMRGCYDLNGAWSPWYTVHKIMVGPRYASLCIGNKAVLAVNQNIAYWAGNIKDFCAAQI